MTDRKTQILDAAAELLQSRSFTSFSYHDLSEQLGIRKASIHYHFATKEVLGVALTERYLSDYTTSLHEIDRNHHDPWSRFEAYVAMVKDVLHTRKNICPTGCLQAEYNVIPAGMQQGASAVYRLIQGWLTMVLADGREQGVMEFPGMPKDQASLIHAAFQGALQIARAEGPKQFNAILRQIRDGMKPKA